MNEILCLLPTFALSFVLTLLLELPIALLFRLRGRELSLFCLVNLLTNPAAVYLNFLLRSVLPARSVFLWQIPIELAVLAVEGYLYSRYSRSLIFPWIFAVSANVFSYAVGLVLSYVL